MVVVLEVCRVGQRPGVLDGVGMLVGCIQDAVASSRKWLLPEASVFRHNAVESFLPAISRIQDGFFGQHTQAENSIV
jgi:hypothetical protein